MGRHPGGRGHCPLVRSVARLGTLLADSTREFDGQDCDVARGDGRAPERGADLCGSDERQCSARAVIQRISSGLAHRIWSALCQRVRVDHHVGHGDCADRPDARATLAPLWLAHARRGREPQVVGTHGSERQACVAGFVDAGDHARRISGCLVRADGDTDQRQQLFGHSRCRYRRCGARGPSVIAPRGSRRRGSRRRTGRRTGLRCLRLGLVPSARAELAILHSVSSPAGTPGDASARESK